MESEPACVKKTLDFVNKVRAKRGWPTLAEMPKGKRRDSFHCPLSNALNNTLAVGWTYGTVSSFNNDKLEQATADAIRSVFKPRGGHPTDNRDTVTLPRYTGQFLDLFDNGDLPEYIDDAE